MKECKKCKTEQPLDSFYLRTQRDGRKEPRHNCKDCHKATATKYYRDNQEKRAVQKKAWAQKNKETVYAGNRRWAITNRDKMRSYYAKRRASKLQATPSWLNEEQLWMMKEVYHAAKVRSEMTGVEHHVDHIVPLQGEQVCGLHVPWNLQVLTAHDNISKGNRCG